MPKSRKSANAPKFAKSMLRLVHHRQRFRSALGPERTNAGASPGSTERLVRNQRGASGVCTPSVVLVAEASILAAGATPKALVNATAPDPTGTKAVGDLAHPSPPYAVTVWAIPVIIAITFHEAAHGFVAHLLGNDTTGQRPFENARRA